MGLMPNELPPVERCGQCFAPLNPDGSCPGAGNHIAQQYNPSYINPPNEPTIVIHPASQRGEEGRQTLRIMSDIELADALHTSATTLMNWRAAGKGPAFCKLGKRVFYRVSAVVTWVESCEKHDAGA